MGSNYRIKIESICPRLGFDDFWEEMQVLIWISWNKSEASSILFNKLIESGHLRTIKVGAWPGRRLRATVPLPSGSHEVRIQELMVTSLN